MFKTLRGYWLEIIIGAVLLYIDLRLFAFFFFVVYLISSEKRTDYLRKLIRTSHIANEIKIVAIANKLEIDESEIEKRFEDMKGKMTDEAAEGLDRDMSSVINLNNLRG